MFWNAMIDRFAKEAPVATMVRALMSNILSASELDAIFREKAERQWEKELLFSTIFDLMGLVVTRSRKTLHAAYQAYHQELGVSAKALYEKTAGVELPVTQELVRRTARRMREVLEVMDPDRPASLPGYQIRIVDGSHLAATEHRIKETRRIRGGPLPGISLVVLDPDRRLVVDMIPCADAYDEERSLIPELVETLEPGQLWISDRNFCTVLWLHEVALNRAFFVQRQHKATPFVETGPRRRTGRTETGVLYEQSGIVPDGFGGNLAVRRIILVLDQPTEDGEDEIRILTNLPEEVSAAEVARLYRSRWTIEGVFGELTLSLNGEIKTLGYPGAALLGYAIALVTFNLLSVVTAALRVAHAKKKDVPETSFYYLADELTGTWRGMTIAVPSKQWDNHFAHRTPRELARDLLRIAGFANMNCYRKHKRGPKKPRIRRTGKSVHVSTGRLLEARKQ